MLPHQLQHLQPVARRPYVLITQRLQHLVEHSLVHQVVLDHENRKGNVAWWGGAVGRPSGGGEWDGGALVRERLQERGVEGVDAHRLGDANDALLDGATPDCFRIGMIRGIS